MKIAVMGAGAVGCYYGGMLARAGHEVVLIGRPLHVDAIRRHGLLLETRTFSEHVNIAAGSTPELLQGASVVLFCVKSTDTEAAAVAMRPFADDGAVVISMQNGVDNASRLQASLSSEVIAAVVYVAAEMAGPGHVRHHGRGELVIGSSRRADMMRTLFFDAGIPVQVSDNVGGELWGKLIVNCVYNALSAITQMPYGVLVAGAEVEKVMRDILAECLAVASAEGVRLPGDPWQTIQAIARSMPTQISSTAQDLRRRKLSEIDHLNGHVTRRGDALGVAVPVNRALYALVKLLEAKP